jgi:hypothetical protein
LSKEEKAFDKFRKLTEKVMSVSRAEIQKRELQWKNGRKKHETHKRHR